MNKEDLPDGIYEQIINTYLKKRLKSLEETRAIGREKIDKKESTAQLSLYIFHIFRQALGLLGNSKSNIQEKIAVCNDIIGRLADLTDDPQLKENLIVDGAEYLLYILERKEKLNRNQIIPDRPKTPISQSALFTGSENEPSLISELKKEILSSNNIDILMSFIRWTGLRLLLPALEEFTSKSGVNLRVITTPYMGVTSPKALRILYDLPNTKVKISYDTSRTRLHAKSYLFYRDSGFTTAYVGSSNITQTAVTNGLEWNVKITQQDNPDLIKKIERTFDSYWNDNEFRIVESQEDLKFFDEAIRNSNMKEKAKNCSPKVFFDIKPKWFQEEILNRLESERENYNNFKNLIVAATGTGKTVMAALDYKRFWQKNRKKGEQAYPTLLFVAHRKEILVQSVETFRAVLQDYNFGDLWVGEYSPSNHRIKHLFMSIQMFNSKDFQNSIDQTYFSYIVIDEFHHAAAKSYQSLLKHFKPKIMLGLTATPERMDGKDVISLFNNRITAELRIFEAINEKLLSPFQYFVVTDDVDLSQLTWVAGGYRNSELEEVYVDNLERCALIITAVEKYIEDIDHIIGLGFCCSIKHAHFMAEQFNQANIPSTALDSNSKPEERRKAQSDLKQGKIKFIFVVDLYNEGVDIKEINTILFLRPTESLTVFLQQLGRGLRICDGKECLTVLDFVGRASKRYSFESKLRALIGKTENRITQEIEEEFPNLPLGCYIHMERIAQDYILENLRKTTLDLKRNLIRKIKNWKRTVDLPLNLENFVNFHQIEPYIIYKRSYWRRLLVEAGIHNEFHEAQEENIAKCLQRLEWSNSKYFLLFIKRFLEVCQNYARESSSKEQFISKLQYYRQKWRINEERMYSMLYYTIWYHHPSKIEDFNSFDESFWVLVQENPIGTAEILDIVNYNLKHIKFVSIPLDLDFENPLEIHCNYSSDQVFAALGYYNEDDKPRFSEGVKYIKQLDLDVFFIELEKKEKHYSPSTLYEDYPISKDLFHWQSQSRTTPSSPTGRRYISTNQNSNHKILIFVREYRKMHGSASPYICLGPTSLVSHTGSKPISFVWKLANEMPPNLLKHIR